MYVEKMKLREPKETENGLTIDPDDDAIIVRHGNYYETIDGKFVYYHNGLFKPRKK